jgi:hypothetical protein
MYMGHLNKFSFKSYSFIDKELERIICGKLGGIKKADASCYPDIRVHLVECVCKAHLHLTMTLDAQGSIVCDPHYFFWQCMILL